MKKGLVIILFLTMSLAGFAQQDVVVNTNPGCKHYKSVGIVKTINELPKDAGKTITYVCTNSGTNWNKGDELTKTLDQLSISEYVISDSFKYHILMINKGN